eukprot:3308415-Rhodomonas_salina.1
MAYLEKNKLQRVALPSSRSKLAVRCPVLTWGMLLSGGDADDAGAGESTRGDVTMVCLARGQVDEKLDGRITEE